MSETGPCAGGCDCCDRRARGDISERDFGPEARLLLSACKALRGMFGITKAISLLRCVPHTSASDLLYQYTLPGIVLLIWRFSRRRDHLTALAFPQSC